MAKNSSQSGRQKKSANFPKCPVCGTRALPKDKAACLVCQPVYSISADLARGAKNWQVLVQTYKNGVQTKVSFVVSISGKNAVVVSGDGKKYWRSNGVAIIPIDFTSKDCKVGFHIVGGPADIRELEVPAEKPAGFKSVKPKKDLGFFKNLMRGIRNED